MGTHWVGMYCLGTHWAVDILGGDTFGGGCIGWDTLGQIYTDRGQIKLVTHMVRIYWLRAH